MQKAPQTSRQISVPSPLAVRELQLHGEGQLGSGEGQARVQIWAPPLSSCVTPHSSLNLSWGGCEILMRQPILSACCKAERSPESSLCGLLSPFQGPLYPVHARVARLTGDDMMQRQPLAQPSAGHCTNASVCTRTRARTHPGSCSGFKESEETGQLNATR